MADSLLPVVLAYVPHIPLHGTISILAASGDSPKQEEECTRCWQPTRLNERKRSIPNQMPIMFGS